MTYAARVPLFPSTVDVRDSTGQARLRVAGCDLEELANQYGTPLYLYDAFTMDRAVGQYHQALSEYYPGASTLVYAGKAYLCLAIAQWTMRHKIWLDCSSAGELKIARAAVIPRERLLLHGVNKSHEDLTYGLSNAGTLAVDNLTELDRIAELTAQGGDISPDLWLRFRPGIEADSHSHIRTGHEESKFGMNEEEIIQAARICRTRQLPLSGLHFHLGSQITDADPIRRAAVKTLELTKKIDMPSDWALSIGGGLGAAYHEDALPQPPISEYVRSVAEAVADGCSEKGLELPHLFLEPGRSLVARAGVAVYRIGAVKHTTSRKWILLDGGMADNPRYALYQARYSALPVSEPLRAYRGPAWFGGPYCESGDVLIESLPFPDVHPGELVAVPMSGAYQLSMASSYNGAQRPAVLWLEEGAAQLIQEREKPEDLLRRDRPLRSGLRTNQPGQS